VAFSRKPPKEPKPPASAYDRALGLLSRREHSARELKRKLSSRGYDAADGDSAIAALNRADYQSDERFAEVLIRQRAANGYGPRHIEAELRQHGIDSRAFSEQLDAQDWLANATVIVQKKAGRRELDRDARLKLAQHLARRGFPSNIVYAATRVPVEGDTPGDE
jgi:regulatory protein